MNWYENCHYYESPGRCGIEGMPCELEMNLPCLLYPDVPLDALEERMREEGELRGE